MGVGRIKTLIRLGFLLILPLSAPLSAAGEDSFLSIEVGRHNETLALSIKDSDPRKVFTLDNPNRLVVDVPALPNPHIRMPAGYDGKLIRGARFGQFDQATSRFVFDLNKPVEVVTVKFESNPPQLLVRIAEKGKGKAAEKTIRSGKKSLPLVVIDPGHGGDDPGTIGNYRTQEKELVLEYAKALKTALEATGRYKVKLTRSDDRFINLRGRVAIARKAKADMFISLHADSAPATMARGLSVYTLSEKASDEEAAALAARENSAGALTSIDLSHESEDVADILISLAQRETNNFSATLADLVVVHAQMHDVPLLPNSHRFAGFAVLKAPDIPSVLIETGFLSNAAEERQLKSRAYRGNVVKAVTSAVDAYFTHRRELEEE